MESSINSISSKLSINSAFYTGIAPAELFFRNAKTTRLPQFKSNFRPNESDEVAIEADNKRKIIMKNEFDRRKNVKEMEIKVYDPVLVKKKQTNKSKSYFEPHKYLVTDIKGNMVSSKRITDRKEEERSTTRNISFFKKWKGSVEGIGENRYESFVDPLNEINHTKKGYLC